MVIDNIKTKNGLVISADKIKIYRKNGKAYEKAYYLWFAQDRLIVTDDANNELESLDILDFVKQSIESH